MSKNFVSLLIEWFCGPICPHCDEHAEQRFGYYSRAYNSLCHQAAGDAGTYCMNCRRITFRTPDFDEWMKTQPAWIVPYPKRAAHRSDQRVPDVPRSTRQDHPEELGRNES